MILAPSLLAADFGRLAEEIAVLRSHGAADWLHCDVMDGRFVPNISFGQPIIAAIRRAAGESLPLDVHLMIEEPGRYLEDFVRAGADRLTVHFEACPHLHRVVGSIRQLGCLAGVALNPHSPVSLLTDIVRDVDLILIMSVNPGFGGQQFIEGTYRRVAEARELLDRVGSRAHLEVDGGVSEENISELVRAGADVLVAGSSVFRNGDPVGALRRLRQAANQAITTP